MRRKVRIEEKVPQTDSLDFKHEIIKDLLYQIDYQTALRHQIANVSEDEMITSLKQLPSSVLLSWYMAYLYIRKELMHAGYELNGFKVMDQPWDTIQEIMNSDPDFDLKQYIF
ncbi:hypothetical protein JW960_26415 [candidate division KSB1 bacterium]|nr:hypothetical protein [candidate division KSB1 bacterium]